MQLVCFEWPSLINFSNVIHDMLLMIPAMLGPDLYHDFAKPDLPFRLPKETLLGTNFNDDID